MNNTIANLIAKARATGATVLVTYDASMKAAEGRDIIETVQVIGLKGCGPFPMCELAATERLSEVLA